MLLMTFLAFLFLCVQEQFSDLAALSVSLIHRYNQITQLFLTRISLLCVLHRKKREPKIFVDRINSKAEERKEWGIAQTRGCSFATATLHLQTQKWFFSLHKGIDKLHRSMLKSLYERSHRRASHLIYFFFNQKEPKRKRFFIILFSQELYLLVFIRKLLEVPPH